MLEKEISVIQGRMPKDVYEQMAVPICDEERGEILERLALRLFTILSTHGIVVEDGSMRVKTQEKIEKKIIKRNSTSPLRDIYGVRFITSDPDRARIAEIIQLAFPLTPEKFENGMPTVRDYADPKMKEFIRGNFNPNIYLLGSAMHVNVIFPIEGRDILGIAEVQILTPEEMKIYKETHFEYKNGKH